ncbi:EF-hand domain-containing protein [Acidovorax sp. ACV01]|uniref:EF-hand domain-containing protein n=1 Tax=Acidovorax sp. ACV01 TaxID=2769311 RepID=UPI001780FFF9|nr:EF-hand domain-containing protein [Acidovorax sp. ACV01]MBD9391594.1 EF-hand domain-containing protein [Acidovorax sp. ACV01]
MRIRFSLAVSAMAAALGSAALATPPAAAPVPPAVSAPAESQAALSKGEIKAMREFKMLDFNGDGKLSRTEVKLFPRLAAAFDDADTDKDGYVSYEEVRALAAKYRAEREHQRAAQATAPASSPRP